jgi:hypothetical protein
LGLQTSFGIKTRAPSKKEPVEPDSKSSRLFPKDIVEIKNTESDRASYLDQIRKKIKAGFYNSDSVVDDISHGFANALDQSF